MRYPYKDYKKTKYSNKADTSIFNSLKLSNIVNTHTYIFRKMNLELIYKKITRDYFIRFFS